MASSGRVVEGHTDLMVDVSRRRTLGERGVIRKRHIPRLREAGVELQFLVVGGDFPMFSADTTWTDYLREALHTLDAFFEELAESGGDAFFPVLGRADLASASSDRTGFILHAEGAGVFEGNLGFLRVLYQLGLRSVGLTWNGVNHAADGCMVEHVRGLSDFGHSLVAECNRLGILIDVSHLAPPGIDDVLEKSTRPVIASHSNARGAYDHPRNLSDEHIRGIARAGGTVGLCAYPPLVSAERADLETIVRHLDYLIDVAGRDHVAIGGDFIDYLDESYFNSAAIQRFRHELTRPFPKGLENVTELPHLVEAMLAHGYADEDVERVMGGNLRRVLKEVLPGNPRSPR